MQKHTVSLCMIVKNEEKSLDKCLKSILGKVDEIIIADTGSTDKTIEIAEKHGAIIKHFNWINDFAAARNFSISEAKSEYILVLDADEYLDDTVDLQRVLEQGKDFYKLMVKNYQSGDRVFFHRNIRLFRSGVGLKYVGRLHEHLNTYEKGTGYKGAESDIIIHHMGYLPEAIEDKDKYKRNYEIMVRELEENPTGFNYYNMGCVYINEKQYDKALDMFRKSYSLGKDKKYVTNLLVRMGECLHVLGKTEEAVEVFQDAIKTYPNFTEFHYKLGVLYLNLGYLRDAEAEFKKCLEIGEKVDDMTVAGIGSYMSNYQLAIVYDRMGRIGDAFDEAYKAITQKKNFTAALSKYLKLMQRAGIQPEEIREHLSKVYVIGTREELKTLIYSLYELRHPLMNKFGFALQNESLSQLRAVALMLDKQLDKSLQEWEQVDIISKPNLLDAVVLCLLTKDMALFDKVMRSASFSSEEWEIVSAVLLNNDMDGFAPTKEVEELLLNICEYLLNISEFEHFDYISGLLLQCSLDIQDKLALMLFANGYTDTAIELLDMIIEKCPKRFESNFLLGEAYLSQSKLQEALRSFNHCLGLKDDYRVYEKMYDTCERMGATKETGELKKIMKNKFSLSMWLKNA